MSRSFSAECHIHREAFTDGQQALFEEHFTTAPHRASRLKELTLPKPRLEGAHIARARPFNPTGRNPGAEVEWTQDVPTGRTEQRRVWNQSTRQDEWVEIPVLEPVHRRGQVWSAGYRAKSVWVIPFDEVADEVELAVLLVEDREGVLRYSETCRSLGRPQMPHKTALAILGSTKSNRESTLRYNTKWRAYIAKHSGDREQFNRITEAAETLGIANAIDVEWVS